MRCLALLVIVASCCVGCASKPTATEVKLGGLFTDNMVLQREMPIAVYGKAKNPPKGTGLVVVSLDKDTAVAKVTPGGSWRATLPSRPAGGPYKLTVAGAEKAITFANVMVGEVWICSGQSNMEMTLSGVSDAPAVRAAANYPDIRLFTVPHTLSAQPAEDVVGVWSSCTPTSAAQFSAVAYYFGRALHRQLGVPIGLINSSWGGTAAESWTTTKTLSASPELAPIVERSTLTAKDYGEAFRRFEQDLKKWQAAHPEWRASFQHDEGNQGVSLGWAKPEFKDSDWKDIRLPSGFEGIIDVNGAFWFRKQLDIPASWAGKQLELQLGQVDDLDITYFNGQQIGATGKDGDQTYIYPRKYPVPASLVKAGKALLAVRVFDHYGAGGFTGSPAFKLTCGSDSVSLAGTWKYKIEKALDPKKLKPVPGSMPFPPSITQQNTGGLFNGMISPLLASGFRGAIWYQGESNTDRSEQYRTLLPAMIGDWRHGAGRNFPFMIVQLPTYGGNTTWAELREAQAATIKTVPHTGMAVILDIPDGDLHPRIKEPVGERLALSALKVAYGWDVPASGPAYKTMKVEGKTIRVQFDNAGGGLAIGGLSAAADPKLAGSLQGFTIAGEDKKFCPATAKIEGDSVVLSSDQVAKPVAARYAYANSTYNCNLVNAEGLPAGTFRTDNWPVETTGKR